MKNFVQPGQVITITAALAVIAGQAYKVGSLTGIATGSLSTADIAAGKDEYELALGGVYEMQDPDSAAVSVGLLVGYVSATNKLSAAGAGDFDLGHVTKITSAGVAHVRLIGGGEASGY